MTDIAAGAGPEDFATSIPPRFNPRAARYAAAQALRVAWYAGHYAIMRGRAGETTPPGEIPYAPKAAAPDPRRVRTALLDLFSQDLANIEAGLYPAPRDVTPRKLTKALANSRRFLADAGSVAERRQARGATEARDLAEARGDRAAYPTYYLQNFHFQTGGWLTRESAKLYDTQVEVLFTGAADAMRRVALCALSKALHGRDQRSASVIDVACGSGRFLEQTLDAFPRLNVTGVDLSPAYVDEAGARLRRWRNAQVIQANAEALPAEDHTYDHAVSIYLFHELPPRVRSVVMGELARVVKPGGLVIVADSIQTGDDPNLDQMLEYFPQLFHEPYYAHYTGDDLNTYASAAGLEAVNTATAFLTKVMTWRKRAG